MSGKKEKIMAAAVSAFSRSDGDDWEIIASEQYEENKKLTQEVDQLKDELSSHNNLNKKINPNLCRNWKYSDRNKFEMGDVEGLAEDIKLNGQLQPIIVRKIDSLDYEYEVIAGERRWRACQLANIDVLATLTNEDDAGCIVIQTSENKKKSLSPYSLAKTYQKLIAELGISQNELAKKLGMAKSSFANLMSFNKVPEDVWSAVEDMSLVKPKTAQFLAMICSDNKEYLHAVIKVADKIRSGVGVDNLKKQIEKYLSNTKSKRNSSSVYKNKKGEFLFRITSEGRVSFSPMVLKKLSVDDLALHIESFINQHS